MKSIFAFLFSMLCISIFSIGQIKFSVSVSYNSFDLSDIKSNQQNALDQLPFDAKVVESFPSYWAIRGKFLFKVNEIVYVGLNYFATSTGGRISYQDFSGSYQLDQNLTLSSIGPTIESLVYKTGNNIFKVYSGLSINIDYTKQKLESILLLKPDIKEQENVEFNSVGFSIWPFLGVDIEVLNWLSITTSLGYQINVKKGLFKNSNFVSSTRPDWSGVRPEFGLSYEF